MDVLIDNTNDIKLVLTDLSDDSYINDATATKMSLFKLAPRERVQILLPNAPATAGTWTLTFNGHTTAAIDWNANLWEIQAALEALLSVITVGDLVVSGDPLDTDPVVNGLEFAWREVFADVNALTFDFSDLTGPSDAASVMTKKTKNLFRGAVVDKGGSPNKVGLPVIRHNAIEGDYIKPEGTENYDGYHTVDAATTENEIVIESAYTAEIFKGRETLYIGITNGTDITLTYVESSSGEYVGTLPDTLKGLLENMDIETSRGTVKQGVYWLFVNATDDPAIFTAKVECKAKFPDGS